MEPENNSKMNKKPEDKLKGTWGRLALAGVLLEFLFFWFFVFRFPLFMVPVSFFLALAALYFRIKKGALDNVGGEIEFSESDLKWIKKYCEFWIFISLYGSVFALLLVFELI